MPSLDLGQHGVYDLRGYHEIVDGFSNSALWTIRANPCWHTAVGLGLGKLEKAWHFLRLTRASQELPQTYHSQLAA